MHEWMNEMVVIKYIVWLEDISNSIFFSSDTHFTIFIACSITCAFFFILFVNVKPVWGVKNRIDKWSRWLKLLVVAKNKKKTKGFWSLMKWKCKMKRRKKIVKDVSKKKWKSRKWNSIEIGLWLKLKMKIMAMCFYFFHHTRFFSSLFPFFPLAT